MVVQVSMQGRCEAVVKLAKASGCRVVKLWVEVYPQSRREFIQSCGEELTVNVNAQSAFTVAMQTIAYPWRERYERL